MAGVVRSEVPAVLIESRALGYEEGGVADAVIARWHGDNYQARVFWEHALNLLSPESCVAEVSFEADGPKAFDDVVVKYDPPIAGSGPDRVAADYQQVKWHVQTGGRFGFEDFVDPEFIGARSFSLLERLEQARRIAPASARFTFLTTYRVADGDPLARLISGNDRSLLVEHMFDGTTDRSRMGRVRKCWREHLKLESDERLRDVVTGLRIVDGHRSLEELRQEVNDKAASVGLVSCSAADSDFRYDELARQLKVRGMNVLDRETLLQVCREEGLVAECIEASDGFLPVAIRSFLGPAADIVGAAPEDTLVLAGEFRQRYLQEGREWQHDIRPRVQSFLTAAVKKCGRLRLILDAHASIAFLAGKVLDLKSGVESQLIQKGRVGTRTWRIDDGSASEGRAFTVEEEQMDGGRHCNCVERVAADDCTCSCLHSTQPDGRRQAHFVRDADRTRAANGRGRGARFGAGRTGFQSSPQPEGLRPGCRCSHLCGRSERTAVLSWAASSGRCAMRCLRIRFRSQAHKTYQPSFVLD